MKIDREIEKELQKLVEQSDLETKCGAVIVRDKKILSSGSAHIITPNNESGQLQIHAEESAILNALNHQVDVSGSDIYVLLLRKSGEIRHTDSSYSCVVCSRLLAQTRISNVIYPTPTSWEKITVAEMLNKAVVRNNEVSHHISKL